MRKQSTYVVVMTLAALLWLPVTAVTQGSGEPSTSSPSSDDFPAAPAATEELTDSPGTTEVAVLAGGCFWGVEAVFEHLIGVQDVRSGYSGGEESTARYREVATGSTGHAESVEVIYDPAVISYGTLLEVFFAVAHDPTQLNYQGPDYGPQYRSAIFYANEHQQKTAEAYIAVIEESGVFDDPVVTEVAPLEGFYPAEEYHQDYVARNRGVGCFGCPDIPKVERLKDAYPELIAPQ